MLLSAYGYPPPPPPVYSTFPHATQPPPTNPPHQPHPQPPTPTNPIPTSASTPPPPSPPHQPHQPTPPPQTPSPPPPPLPRSCVSFTMLCQEDFLSHHGWYRFSTNCDQHARLLSSILYPIIEDAPTQLWFDRRQNRSPIPTLSYCSMITTTSLFQNYHMAIHKCMFCILSIGKSDSNISHREMSPWTPVKKWHKAWNQDLFYWQRLTDIWAWIVMMSTVM